AVAALDTTGHAVFNLPMLIVTLTLAAFLGNLLNFQIGRWLGPKVFHWEKSRLFNPRHLAEAHAFYERHGGKTVVISRFLPILRTYAPFVAGVGDMSHSRFMAFNALGAFLWVVLLLMTGYFFGNVPFIKNNLSFMIAGIVAITLLPLVVAGIWARFRKRT
ncbi:MAG: VTT domain-containing protein, partial [Betaproteobacteria bacterium]|nr:VTT domain-containing protein [Betaproteobacteria bacterium]